jgi:3-isopropylmalate dehydrogenase
MSRKRYSISFLAGHGIGAEITAQASRVAAAAAAMHGFTLDDEHVAFGSDAFVRYGNPFPPASRRAVAASDAVLVPADDGGALDALEAELDLQASVVRVRVDERTQVTLVAPLDDDHWDWAVERAFELASHSRARLTLVRADDGPRRMAAAAALESDGIAFERVGLGDAVRRLVEDPRGLDVVLCRPEDVHTAAEVAGCTSPTRVAAWGRVGPRGPGVFGPTHGPATEIAGQGVADPRSMMLAAALMLGVGLGEHAAAETVSAAVARTPVEDNAHSTASFGDRVLAELPQSLRFEFGGAVA